MSDETNLPAPHGQFLIYTDGASRLQVRLEGNTVWLTQKLIAELYGVSVKTVNEHLVNIYSDAELPPEATVRKFRIVQGRMTLALACYNTLSLGFATIDKIAKHSLVLTRGLQA